MPNDSALREQLIEMLTGGNAHATFEDAVRGIPLDRVGIRPHNTPHSAWELLEHIRISQNDILEFSRSANHVSPKWPDGYWPRSAAPQRQADWKEAIDKFHEDMAAFEELLRDPARDLHAPFPWSDGQTLLREALLIADHNSYHLGQLILVRRLLGTWKK